MEVMYRERIDGAMGEKKVASCLKNTVIGSGQHEELFFFFFFAKLIFKPSSYIKKILSWIYTCWHISNKAVKQAHEKPISWKSKEYPGREIS